MRHILKGIGERRLIVYFSLVVFGSMLASIPYLNCLGDDSFIYMRLIENFLHSGRIEYNHGKPCFAMSSVLHFFAWSGLSWLVGSIDRARIFISIISHLAACSILILLARKLIGEAKVMIIAMVVIFLDPFYLRWFWSGWEVGFKIALPAATLLAVIVSGRKKSSKISFCAGLLAGLSFLERPEAAILCVLALLFVPILNRKRAVALMIAYVLGLMLITVPWFVYSYRTFGLLLPHTVSAKTGAVTWRYLGVMVPKFLKIVFLPPLPFLMIVCGLMVIAWRKEKPDFRSVFKDRRDLWEFSFVSIWGLTICGYLISGVYIASIKTLMFTPFLVLAVAMLCDRIAAGILKASRGIARWTVPGAIAAVLVVSLLVQSHLYLRYSFLVSDRFVNGADRNFIVFSKKIGELVKEDERVGLWELGVIGYYSKRQIVDFAGLASPDIVKCRKKHGDHWPDYYFADKGSLPEYIVSVMSRAEFRSEGEKDRVFFGQSYHPVLVEEVQRIGGKFSEDYAEKYILYRNNRLKLPVVGDA